MLQRKKYDLWPWRSRSRSNRQTSVFLWISRLKLIIIIIIIMIKIISCQGWRMRGRHNVSKYFVTGMVSHYDHFVSGLVWLYANSTGSNRPFAEIFLCLIINTIWRQSNLEIYLNMKINKASCISYKNNDFFIFSPKLMIPKNRTFSILYMYWNRAILASIFLISYSQHARREW